MSKLKEIIKSKQDIENLGYSIENNILKEIDVNVIAHFGNTTCLELFCRDVSIMRTYNNLSNLGYLIKALVEFLEIEEEDGKRISSIKNIPIRIIINNSTCVGFGHFMKNKFVLTDDFAKIDNT